MTAAEPVTPADAYEAYFGPAIFAPLASMLVDVAAPQVGQRVLDVACGTGIVARQVARQVGPTGRVVGVDVNPQMIQTARRQPLSPQARIEWRQGDAVDLDLPDGDFDLVLCQQGLQFFADRLAGLQQMRRVLRGGGRLALAVWQGLDRHPLYEALLDAEEPALRAFGVPASRDELAAPFNLGDPDELCALLSAAGFVGVDVLDRCVEARFSDPDRFVERMEYAYAAVVPQFAEDPATFAAYLDAVNQSTKAIVERYRHGDVVVVPMRTHIAVASPAAG